MRNSLLEDQNHSIVLLQYIIHYNIQYIRGRQPMARGPNVALFKNIMALFKSRGAKKRSPKKFGKIGKKVRISGPQQKKVPNFPIFLAHLPKKVGDPCNILYIIYIIIYNILYHMNETLIWFRLHM